MTTHPAAFRRDTNLLSDSAIATLRAALEEAHEAQCLLVTERRATALDLIGQADTDSLLERELAEHAAEQAEEVIVGIEDALRRIDAGTYGLCERCSGPIAFERLEAIPHTRHCVRCPDERPRRA